MTKASAQEDPDAGVGHVQVERAVGPVEAEQGEAGHDRRQGEGQVDDRARPAACRGTVTDEHPGDGQAGDGVDDGHAPASDSKVSFEGGHASGWLTASQKS